MDPTTQTPSLARILSEHQRQSALPPRILIVDGDDRAARLLVRLFQREGFEAWATSEGREALRTAQRCRPDILILETLVPGLVGPRICERVRAQRGLAQVLVLFLTRQDSLEAIVEAFGAGADDYLCKPFSQRELLWRVGALLRRRTGQETPRGALLQVGGLCLDASRATVTANGKPLSLPPLHVKLLGYLMSRAGEATPAEMLLQEVWGYPVGTGDPALVRSHIHQLRKHLENGPGTQAMVRTIPRRGYIVEPVGASRL